MDWLKLQSEFPMIRNNPHLSYLDSASTALTPDCVIDAINDYYQNHNTNTSRGVDRVLYETTDIFESTRSTVQTFLNAKMSEEIVFTRGTTDSLNMIAFGLNKMVNEEDEIILNISEHHANIIPWQELSNKTGAKIVYTPITQTGEIDVEAFKSHLSTKTRVVSFAHMTNVFGSFNDPFTLVPIIRKHAPNAFIVIDGAQGVLQKEVDVISFDCDFYAFSGHKLYGPTGIGILYGKYDLLQQMEPLTFGGDMNFQVGHFESIYKDAPHKFEAGTMMIAESFGLKAAIDFFQKINKEEKNAYIKKLRAYAISELKAFNHVDLYNEGCEDSATLAFNIKSLPAHDAASMFSNHNVVIRAGHHCAQLLLEHIDAPSSLRASFSFYNTKADVDAFIEVIKILEDEGAFLDVLF